MNLTRRTFLSLPLAASLVPAPRPRAASALIVLWLDGGMSHLDTFDGKPEAAADIRGDLKSVPAGRDGVFVSAHLPRLAARMSRCVLVRSLTHGEGNHDRGSHLLLTGHRPSPVLVHPALGSVLASGADALPPYVAVPTAPEYGGPGFLGPQRAPFAFDPDKSRAGGGGGATSRAHALLQAQDAASGPPWSSSEAAHTVFAARAAALRADPAARELFELAREPAATRERYGRHRLGQSLLLARRLVAGGVRSVLVHDIGWDHHQNIKHALTYGFPPQLEALDQGLAALLDDLEDTDLGARTVVALLSEFGRTPRLNPIGGRDHWPRAQSVLLHGCGLARGKVIGTTDARGEEPAQDPVTPQEVHATIWKALGLPLDTRLHTADGRPIPLFGGEAQPLAEALA